jgi:hypothetical protein
MSNNHVTLTSDHLVVEPLGLDKVWSFTRRVRVPLTHVRGATLDPGVRREPKGWRAPGLHLPGKLAGTFRSQGRQQFWNVSGFERAVVITLDPTQRYEQIVVTVDDPDDVVAGINAAVGAR